VPFRVAHHVVGTLVGRAERDGVRRLADLPPSAVVEELAAADDPTARSLASEPGTAESLLAAATIEGSLAAADVTGGTSPARVTAAIAAARARLEAARSR
jgi:argininosuccinate lyase